MKNHSRGGNHSLGICSFQSWHCVRIMPLMKMRILQVRSRTYYDMSTTKYFWYDILASWAFWSKPLSSRGDNSALTCAMFLIDSAQIPKRRVDRVSGSFYEDGVQLMISVVQKFPPKDPCKMHLSLESSYSICLAWGCDKQGRTCNASIDSPCYRSMHLSPFLKPKVIYWFFSPCLVFVQKLLSSRPFPKQQDGSVTVFKWRRQVSVWGFVDWCLPPSSKMTNNSLSLSLETNGMWWPESGITWLAWIGIRAFSGGVLAEEGEGLC